MHCQKYQLSQYSHLKSLHALVRKSFEKHVKKSVPGSSGSQPTSTITMCVSCKKCKSLKQDPHAVTPKCSLRTTQIFLTDTLLTCFDFLTFFVETHEISNLHTHTHTRCQKKGVLSGADLIHRYTFTLFYLLFGRPHPRLRPRRDFWTSTAYPSREVYSGRAPPPPSNYNST